MRQRTATKRSMKVMGEGETVSLTLSLSFTLLYLHTFSASFKVWKIKRGQRAWASINDCNHHHQHHRRPHSTPQFATTPVEEWMTFTWESVRCGDTCCCYCQGNKYNTRKSSNYNWISNMSTIAEENNKLKWKRKRVTGDKTAIWWLWWGEWAHTHQKW